MSMRWQKWEWAAGPQTDSGFSTLPTTSQKTSIPPSSPVIVTEKLNLSEYDLILKLASECSKSKYKYITQIYYVWEKVRKYQDIRPCCWRRFQVLEFYLKFRGDNIKEVSLYIPVFLSKKMMSVYLTVHPVSTYA